MEGPLDVGYHDTVLMIDAKRLHYHNNQRGTWQGLGRG
jgi:hypothetical protein